MTTKTSVLKLNVEKGKPGRLTHCKLLVVDWAQTGSKKAAYLVTVDDLLTEVQEYVGLHARAVEAAHQKRWDQLLDLLAAHGRVIALTRDPEGK